MSLRGLIVGAGLLFFGGADAFEGELRRFSLVVGSNNGGEERVKLRYAGTDAVAFGQVMRDLGGVSASDLTVLMEPDSRSFLNAIEDLSNRAAKAHRAGARVEVVVYYSGHSDERGLLPSGDTLSYGSLRDAVSAIPSEVRVSIVDACASGALIRTKGGVRRPAFLAGASHDVEGEAFLTSSTADEASQESDAVGASYFTYHLNIGLRGAADTNADSLVTLSEAYTYAFRETLRSTENSRVGPQHPNYSIDLMGQGDFVMTDLREADARLVLASAVDGEIWLRDTADAMVAQIDKTPGKPMMLDVPPGEYRVQLQTRPTPFEATVEVPRSGEVLLAAADFAPVESELEVNRLRGDVPTDTVAADVVPDPAAVVPFGFGLVPGVGTKADRKVQGLAFNILGGRVHSLQGMEIGLGLNMEVYGVDGMQMGIVGNVAGGTVQGIQLGVGGNWAGSVRGLQIAAGFNGAKKRLDGVQISAGANLAMHENTHPHNGLQATAGVNVVSGSFYGAQLGSVNVATRTTAGMQFGVVNVSAQRMTGAQFGMVNHTTKGSGLQLGVVNSSASFKGAQIGVVNTNWQGSGFMFGVVNVARRLDGAAIGVLNFIGNGYHAVEINTDDMTPLQLTTKFGSRNFYTLLGIGWAPGSDIGFSASAGFGLHAQAGILSIDSDISFRTPVNYTVLSVDPVPGGRDTTTYWPPVATLRTGIGLRVVGPFHLHASPTLNFAFHEQGMGIPPEQSYMPTSFAVGQTVRGWVGFTAGTRFTF